MKKDLLILSLIFNSALLLNASNFDTKVSVGATSAKLDSENYTQYGVGYTSNTKLDSGIILGFGNSLYYGNVTNGTEVTTIDMDLRTGYEIIKDLVGYGIGTGVYQYFDDNSATGLGYGAALEYKLTDNIALEGSYKTTNMNYSTKNYDYETSNLAVKFKF